MSQTEINELRARGYARVPTIEKNPAAVALGKLAKGHKKTGLSESEIERRRALGKKMAPGLARRRWDKRNAEIAAALVAGGHARGI